MDLVVTRITQQERPHTARYPPCTSKVMADPPPSSRALVLGGAGISVPTAVSKYG